MNDDYGANMTPKPGKKIPHCFKCNEIIVWDENRVGKNGKLIPLDPVTHQPHSCKEPPQQQEQEEEDVYEKEYRMPPPPRPPAYQQQQFQPQPGSKTMKLKILSHASGAEVQDEYNRLSEVADIRFSQSHVTDHNEMLVYTVFILYVER